MSALKEDTNDNKFLTFYIKDELYALSVKNVKEILEYSVITKVPLMHECISGITNIRGSVIPVIDLGILLNLKETQSINKRTSIIIIEKEDPIQNFNIGLIVDEVNQVFDILAKEQENTPSFGSKIRKDFIENIGKVNGLFVPILDSAALVNIDELSEVSSVKDI